MSVQRSQSSVQRGKNASFVVEVSTENGSASGVSVALTSQPASQKPTFSSGCGKDGTATCAVGSVTDKKAVSLDAQIPVAASAKSVTSVTLTATASVTTSAKWTPPAAAQSVSVTAASVPPAKSSPGTSPSQTALPLGPLPDLNSAASHLIGPGNAASLFPAIVPSGSSSPSPGTHPQGSAQQRNARPVSDSSALGLGTPVLTAQVAGLIALAAGIMLTVTRLSLLKRFRSRKQGS